MADMSSDNTTEVVEEEVEEVEEEGVKKKTTLCEHKSLCRTFAACSWSKERASMRERITREPRSGFESFESDGRKSSSVAIPVVVVPKTCCVRSGGGGDGDLVGVGGRGDDEFERRRRSGDFERGGAREELLLVGCKDDIGGGTTDGEKALSTVGMWNTNPYRMRSPSWNQPTHSSMRISPSEAVKAP